MRLLYTFFIRIYYLVIVLAAPFNAKAKQWLRGRKSQKFPTKTEGETLWFHAASLGEFEQGRPVIEALKKKEPELKILLTFFSPSGYEVRKNYEYADYVFYLPLDTPAEARRFVELFNPKFAVFIKYEYWYNFLKVLKNKDIPYYFISAIYRPGQIFFKFYGAWFRKHLKSAAHIFCQDERSAALLGAAGIANHSVAGDTRFDSVAAVKEKALEVNKVKAFAEGARLLLAGSSWPAGEKIIATFMEKAPEDVKVVIAPHIVDKQHIDEIVKLFSPYKPLLFSQTDKETDFTHSRVLIVDSVGFLMHLYRYCHIAYIGGGFGAGIHNILEAAAFSKPVVFGPRYHKFNEAKDLLDLGGAFSVKNAADFEEVIGKLLSDSDLYRMASSVADAYVREKTGAAALIAGKLLGK